MVPFCCTSIVESVLLFHSLDALLALKKKEEEEGKTKTSYNILHHYGN